MPRVATTCYNGCMDTTRDEWLTTNEVAALLKVHPETVKRWLRSGEMLGSLLGDRTGWRVEATEVRRFMADRAAGREIPQREDAKKAG